jgi:hypothetical protein
MASEKELRRKAAGKGAENEINSDITPATFNIKISAVSQ